MSLTKIFWHILESDPKTPPKNFGVRSGRVVEIWVMKIFRVAGGRSSQLMMRLRLRVKNFDHLYLHYPTTPDTKFFEGVLGSLPNVSYKKK